MILDISSDVTIRTENISAIKRLESGMAVVFIDGQIFPSNIEFEQLKQFMQNNDRIKTELAY